MAKVEIKIPAMTAVWDVPDAEVETFKAHASAAMADPKAAHNAIEHIVHEDRQHRGHKGKPAKLVSITPG